ncbi:MAG TPA: HAD family hydrolase [Syntrophales bacterium]|nr:HAD family hydrolase [Syntrophales bacterium]HOX93382.1 HAD family hydrolase [Syntrophales bacterium]HPI56073.1 HAD family hydrolase [Syntrophales bacterium]HPN24037.1 HAD family hydrolase [Syntrophales bacterium]HQM28316.1 HAD family hydrolase [Syntrophales bacterium]
MEDLFIFDFDGVIVDSLGLYEKSVNVCLETMGLSPIGSREEFLSLFDDNFYEAIARRGVDVRAFTKVAASVAPTLDYDSVRPFPELIPVLKKLRKGKRFVIISSNSARAIRLILKRHGLERCFDDILGYEFMLGKSEKILHAMKAFGTERERSYYIGDTKGDIKEARSAGVKTIGVTWGWHPRERLAEAGPDYLIDSPEELLEC